MLRLDGLQSGPIDHGECTAANWLALARTVIEARIAQVTGHLQLQSTHTCGARTVRHMAIATIAADMGSLLLPICDHGRSLTAAARRCLVVQYEGSEIRFNLMALVQDRTALYTQRITELQATLADASASGDAQAAAGIPHPRSQLFLLGWLLVLRMFLLFFSSLFRCLRALMWAAAGDSG